MREAGIQGKMVCKHRPHTTQPHPTHPVVANVLDRYFTAKRSNEVWLTDITYIDTAEGFLYLAAIMDLYLRQIVGMAMADHLRTNLVESALDMALTQHRPPHNLLHYSDRGSQYTSFDYQKRLSASHMTVSTSRVGNCWDKAPMESFWATLKREYADVVLLPTLKPGLNSSVTSWAFTIATVVIRLWATLVHILLNPGDSPSLH